MREVLARSTAGDAGIWAGDGGGWRGSWQGGEGVDDEDDCVEGSDVREERNVEMDIEAAATRGGTTARRYDTVVAGSLCGNGRVMDDEKR